MSLLNTEYVKFNSRCKNLFREFGLYSWDNKSLEDKVIKEFDHATDNFRYLTNTILLNEFDHLDWGKQR